jgi:acyl-CoA thioester hydrolase
MFDSPIICPEQRVDEAWIDYNGHMNMAFYNLVFDRALDFVYDTLGIGVDYVRAHGGSCFTAEVHVSYLSELVVDDPIRVTFQLLDWDEKRLHFFEQMYHATTGELAATSEQIGLHVDMATRRATPFPADAQTRIAELWAAHDGMARPEQVGSVIGIRRKAPA